MEDTDANKKYHFYLTNGTAIYTYTIDRGAYDGAKYEKNLEIGHAYLLPAISKWTNHYAPANDEIWYTNGSTTELTPPTTPTAFGDATIQSITYNAQKKCWVIKFNKDLTEIGMGAFAECGNLTSVIIPDSVTTIGGYAFCDCQSLKSVTIPDSVTTIGNFAFAGCKLLTSITIPDSVTTIGDGAFDSCASLTSVTIPDSVTTIGGAPFSYCENLKEFKGKFAADNGRCLIMDNTIIAYANASGTTYTIPDSVTTIRNWVFGGCTSLTSVTIPDSVTTIGESAFKDCKSLASVYCKATTPPAGGSDMFNNNAPERKIYVPAGSVDAYKSAEYWSDYADAIFAEGVESESANDEIWYTNGSTTEPTAPYNPAAFGDATIQSNTYNAEKECWVIKFNKDLTEIGWAAFGLCTSLISVTIPDSVTTIGEAAFAECESLTSVYCKATTPPAGGDNMFSGNAVGRKIYVPASSVNAYKSAEYWSAYADAIVAE